MGDDTLVSVLLSDTGTWAVLVAVLLVMLLAVSDDGSLTGAWLMDDVTREESDGVVCVMMSESASGCLPVEKQVFLSEKKKTI